MLLSTIGTTPARFSLEKVCVCKSLMFDAGGVLGGGPLEEESKALLVEE